MTQVLLTAMRDGKLRATATAAAITAVLTAGLAGCAAGTGQSVPAVEDEARQFMETYAAEFRAGDFESVIGRYHRDGAYVVGYGNKEFFPFDSIALRYPQGLPAPALFELGDLSFEVLSNDAVVVAGTFRLKFLPEDPEEVTSYTGLLVRQDGELRIRLEDESSHNPRSFSCAPDVELCERPLDHGVARYTGEYLSGTQRIRVFEQDGHLMIEPRALPPMRMLYDDVDDFRLARNPSYRIRFGGDGPTATSIAVFQGVLRSAGRRVAEHP